MTRLIYASTRQADMRYAIGMDFVDAFFYLETESEKLIFLDQREIGVFAEKNENQDLKGVLNAELARQASEKKLKTSNENGLALQIIKTYCAENEAVCVPEYFPLGMADFLRSQGVKIQTQNSFFPNREIKNEKEVSYIRENIAKTTKAFRRIEEILRASSIKDDHLIFEDQRLTSEFVKKECDRILLEEDMFNDMNIIISSGPHTAHPHHHGEGCLQPHVPIICDIFPRSRKNGYFADMTRTYVKGKPSEMFEEMYEAVLAAQQEAFKNIKAGVKAKDVHTAVSQIFTQRGFHIGDVGFVHGTGHGLGLEVHEQPFINATSESVLQAGNIVTVEPGLYYPDHGGIRIEDVVLVTKDGCENLTNYPKEFLIR
ncbi:MAG: aminopeptidase P family protein [Candidatus Moranbacteria bacterium]|nr:aminopeptidase P family protein [Candidatus Moranbacteria bacterium]